MTYNHYKMQPAEQVNSALASLPVGELKDVFLYTENAEGKKVGKAHDNFKGIIVNDKMIAAVTPKYVLTQHEQAFRPLVNGVTVSGVKDFQFVTWATDKYANISIVVGQGNDGVKFGFKANNRIDGHGAIHFGFEGYNQTETVELWGFRQVCSNGMVVKVPLNEKWDYVDTVTRTKVEQLLMETAKITHIGINVDSKLQAVQYVVEAFLLLEPALNKMIDEAQEYTLSKEEAKKLIKLYVGKRRMDKYMELYGKEEQTLWGLHNSITYLASHEVNLTQGTRDSLLGNAADLMTKQLVVRKKVRMQNAMEEKGSAGNAASPL